ncbi:hypothetical protein [Saccharothrix luteola]|uniref:hypothetical protein n=1 Tax=Saccharothrix luteola TaxID=2893018 RepID=UPI003556E7CB
MDCSGLTKAAYAAAGVVLPRTAQTIHHTRDQLSLTTASSSAFNRACSAFSSRAQRRQSPVLALRLRRARWPVS